MRVVARAAKFCHLTRMILRPDQVIAARPAKDIRKLLREIRHLQVSCEHVQHVLGCPMEEAKQIIRALEKEGYLSRTGRHEGCDLYETTLKGNQLAGANLRPISRTTADKTLKAFLQRVRAVNADPDYLETITGVIVFGSFLSARKELGDVDVGIRLERKAMGDELFMQLAEMRRKLAQERGRRFRNLSEWVTWPSHEIWMFLKSRANQLSIHDFRELQRLPPFRSKILLGERRALVKSLPNAQFVDSNVG
jgi:predicted nucleotidyltransferase